MPANTQVEHHVVEKFINPSTWALIQDKFSPFAKETLTKVVHFIHVRSLLAGVVRSCR